MNARIGQLVLALALVAGGLPLRADDAKSPAPSKADAPKSDAGKPGTGEERKDDRRPRGDRPPGDRPERGEGGPRFDGPRPEGGPRGDWGGRGRTLDSFSADELREMIRAVEGSNKKLAEKMKDRFEEAIARKPSSLTKEQVDAAMAIFEDREPHLAKRLKEYLADNPQRVSAMLAMQWPRLEKTIELKKSDPELYNAQTAEILRQGESRGIAWRLHLAMKAKDEAETTKLKAELKAKLTEQHEARQAIRRLERDRLNEQVAKLSAEIAGEESKSTEAIDSRFRDIVKWAETGRWDRGRGDGRGDRNGREERPEKKESQKQEPGTK